MSDVIRNGGFSRIFESAYGEKPVPIDIIGLVNQWNTDAGRTSEYFNARQTAFYTGMQCEEMAEKLEACGLHGIAADLERVGKELKEGLWDKVVVQGNREAMLDADADIMVVTIGSAQGQGANFKRAMAKVIEANERKRFPDGRLHKDPNGKIIKPAGWTPPDLSDCLAES